MITSIFKAVENAFLLNYASLLKYLVSLKMALKAENFEVSVYGICIRWHINSQSCRVRQ